MLNKTTNTDFPALYPASPGGVAVHCRFSTSGCPYRLPSMEFHEERRCRFRPTRCPSLTCPDKPPYARLMEHIQVLSDLRGLEHWNILRKMLG